MNLTVVIVELDAKALVDALNNPKYSNSVIYPLFDDCKQLAIRIPHLCIRHIYHEANKCVDRLDSLALLQPLDYVNHSCPPVDLVSFVEADY